MNKLPGISSRNKAPRSLVLFFILISSISSVSLPGYIISPQEVWANHAAPVLEDPANGACTGDNTPNLNWANSASSGVLNYKVEVVVPRDVAPLNTSIVNPASPEVPEIVDIAVFCVPAVGEVMTGAVGTLASITSVNVEL